MKKQIKRCLLLFVCFSLMIGMLSQTAFAANDLPVEEEPWNYLWIYGEDNIANPDAIIIYLHGHDNSGHNVLELENFKYVDHPLRYAREDTLPLPDNVMFVCPQSHYNGEFSYEKEALADFIHEIAECFPEASIILSGHSSGSIATYAIAMTEHEDVDGYVFISGQKPDGTKGLTTQLNNCLVVYGDELWLRDRDDYSILFDEIDISKKKYASGEFVHHEEETNNAYIKGPWWHGQAPIVFLEDFFWEWLNNI